MTKRMIDPKPYIALVDAFNALEPVVKTLATKTSVLGIIFPEYDGNRGMGLEFGGHYSVEYDSEADRWTLVSETDDAPTLCSFNQTQDECYQLERCEQCQEVAEMLADEIDSRA